MRTLLIVAVLSAITGGFLGYSIGFRPVDEFEEDTAQHVSRKGKIADKGDAAQVKALRRRVRELERELAEARRSEPRPDIDGGLGTDRRTAGHQSEVVGESGPKSGHERFRDGLAKLEKTDPERYTQITNRMAQFRQRRLERAASKLDFLSSIDISRMTSDEQKVHNDLQDMIVRREELEEQLRNRDLPIEDRRAIMEQMRDTDHAMRDANASEQNALLLLLGDSMGYSAEDSKALADSAKAIFDATTR